jgi:hypothetical protein
MKLSMRFAWDGLPSHFPRCASSIGLGGAHFLACTRDRGVGPGSDRAGAARRVGERLP